MIRRNVDDLDRILNLIYATDKLARWRLRFYELELDMINQAVIKSQAAYVSSQLMTTGAGNTLVHDKISEMAVISIETNKYDDEDDSDNHLVCCTYEDWDV